MKRFLCCWVLSVEIACFSAGQTIHYPLRIEGMGIGAGIKPFADAFSFVLNPASLASQESLTAGVYDERRFLMSELNLYSLACSFPAAGGGLGVQLAYSGFAAYNESTIMLAYGKKLGKLIDLGVQFNYTLFHISGYGPAGSVQAAAGMLIHPSEKMTLGVYVFNPAGENIGKHSGEKIASLYKTSMGYYASAQVYVGVDLIKEEGRPFAMQVAMHYQFAGQFFAGLGILTFPGIPYGWAGWMRKGLRIDMHVSYHPQLGFTPALACFLGSPFHHKD